MPAGGEGNAGDVRNVPSPGATPQDAVDVAPRRLDLPVSAAAVRELRVGESVLLSGYLYSARDAAHRRLVEALRRGEPLPVPLAGQFIYYLGPTPPRPGRVIGSAGPTTASRMDPYTVDLLAAGVLGTIGKGPRSQALREALVRHGAVYLGAVGGLGALLSQKIVECRVVAYPDLGPEAIRLLRVEDFPTVVIYDAFGGDWYTQAQRRYHNPV